MSCPHCGGETGLYYEVMQTYSQYFSWDGENLGPSDADGVQSRTVRCIDCRRPVTKQAHKIRPYNIYDKIARHKIYDMGDSIA